MWQYYAQWARMAFAHSWTISDLIGGIAGLAIPVVSKIFNVSDQQTMNDLAWQIPLTALTMLVGVRLLLAPYWMQKENEKKREAWELEKIDLQKEIAKLSTKNPELAIKQDRLKTELGEFSILLERLRDKDDFLAGHDFLVQERKANTFVTEKLGYELFRRTKPLPTRKAMPMREMRDRVRRGLPARDNTFSESEVIAIIACCEDRIAHLNKLLAMYS